MVDEDEVEEIKNELETVKSKTKELENRLDSLTTKEKTKEKKTNSSETKNKDDKTTKKTDSNSEKQKATEDSSTVSRLEKLIGAKLFLYIGSTALILSALFLIQIAISAGLIGPLGRVLLAFFAGAAITSAGHYSYKNMNSSLWGRVSIGTGYIISYIAIYASYGSESYREAIGTSFWLMCTLITIFVVISFAHTLKLNFRRVSIVPSSLLWITAIIVGLNVDTQSIYIGYIILGVMSTAGLTYVKKWGSPILSTTIFGYTSIYLLFETFYNSGIQTEKTVLLLSLFALITLTIETIRNANRTNFSSINIISAFNLVVPIFIIGLTYRFEGVELGFAIFALFVGTLMVTLRTTISELTDSAITESVSIFLLLALSATYIGDASLRIILVSLLVLAAFTAQNFYKNDWVKIGAHISSVFLIFESYLLVFDSPDLTFFSIQDIYVRAITLFALLIAIYVTFWLSKEDITTVGAKRLGNINGKITPLYGWSGAYILVLIGLTTFSEVTLSIVWLLTGVSLLLVGAKMELPSLRVQGIFIVGLTIGKVFLLDTSGLNPLSRLLSFMALGVVLLAISYLYNKREDLDIPILGDLFD